MPVNALAIDVADVAAAVGIAGAALHFSQRRQLHTYGKSWLEAAPFSCGGTLCVLRWPHLSGPTA